jgi:hypothetical protein
VGENEGCSGEGWRGSLKCTIDAAKRREVQAGHAAHLSTIPLSRGWDAPKLLLTSAAGYTRLLWPLHGIIDQSLIEMFPGAEKSHIARTLGYSSVRPAKRTVSWGSGM